MLKNTRIYIILILFLILCACCYLNKAHKTHEVIGQYQGIFPCGDCSGIKATLILLADNKYVFLKDYQDTEETRRVEGNWKVLWLSPIIRLSHSEEEFYIINSDTLELLSRNGQRIKTKLNYKIKRVSENE